MSSDIAGFYKGKNLFITGATGFVGLVLIEKFLRCIPEIGNIYLLMRPKKGKDVNTRLEDITKDRIFAKLKELKGDSQFSKLIPVEGDVGEENLGLNDQEEKVIIDNVNLVFHVAATLDFEASLKPTVQINLLGTRRVVDLCKKITNIQGLLHVSSAYVNSHLNSANEVLYDAPDDPNKVIELTNTLDEDALQHISKSVLKEYINTYTFTKQLAEHEVVKGHSKFPTAIVRPSMIIGVWKDPIPGWTNSKNGPQGFIMGAAKGVVRRLPTKTNLIYDYIPVDIVVNEMIAALWYTAESKPEKTAIFHCTTSTYHPFRWSILENEISKWLHNNPLKSAVWYPHLKFIPSLFLFRISAMIFHMIPAYILDNVLKLTGKRPILVRMHTNILNSLDRLKPFIFKEWMFHNTETIKLHNRLSADDKKVFGVDVKDLDWKNFFINLVLGVRQYLNNEDLSTLPAARKKDSILWGFNLAVQVLVVIFLWVTVNTFTGSNVYSSMILFPLFSLISYFL